MTLPSRRLLLMTSVLAAVGCHHCGDRTQLLPRLRSTPTSPTPDPAVAARQSTAGSREIDPCACAEGMTAGRGGYDPTGYPVSNGKGGYVSPISGIPYSPPTMPGGYPAQPSYPSGNPILIGPPPTSRDDELPTPGQYTIPSPGVPLAPPRPTDGTKMFPPLGGGGIVTGDPKK